MESDQGHGQQSEFSYLTYLRVFNWSWPGMRVDLKHGDWSMCSTVMWIIVGRIGKLGWEDGLTGNRNPRQMRRWLVEKRWDCEQWFPVHGLQFHVSASFRLPAHIFHWLEPYGSHLRRHVLCSAHPTLSQPLLQRTAIWKICFWVAWSSVLPPGQVRESFLE